MVKLMDRIRAPCSVCARETYHNVLYSTRGSDGVTEYALIECGGCGRVSMREEVKAPPGHEFDPFVHYYPSPVSRQKPKWLWEFPWWIEGEEHTRELRHLLLEVYEAVAGGQLRLAAMGIRALLEQVMVSKVGDQGSFTRNLDAFHDRGFISLVQRDAMSAILDAGHAVTHRSFNPRKEDLDTALDIAEGIVAAIYVHTEAATKIADRVPPRPPRPAKGR